MPSREELASYPGIYPLGSEMDRVLSAGEDADDLVWRQEGEIVDAGVLSPELNPQWSRPIQTDNLANVAYCEFLDWATVRELDWCLRWCRWRLEIEGVSYDGRHDGQDALGRVLTAGIWHSAIWYAAKVLAHFRRADQLIQTAQDGEPANFFGIIRELMLVGETWAEAKFVVDHGYNAVRGRKTLIASRRGGNERRNKLAPQTEAVIAEMRRLIGTGHSIERAAVILAGKGIGASQAANVKAWQRAARKLGHTPPLSD